MLTEMIEDLTHHISELATSHDIGRVDATDGGQILVSGLSGKVAIGDRAEIDLGKAASIFGEVVKIRDDAVTVMPDGPLLGLVLGSRVISHPPLRLYPTDQWVGRILDPNGNPLDGRPLRKGKRGVPLTIAAPDAAQRRGLGARLKTGSYALNTVLPLVVGQRLGLFAGSGVGKTTLLSTLVRNVDCDVVVLGLVGERGRELRHFTQNVLGPEGLKKSVIVAATSDRSALERRRCAWSAMAVAEHFRNEGKSVLLVADSITRFAEAHREIASAAGELPVLRGYPPSTAQLITEFCERAGPGVNGNGDITAVLSVLVQGSDMDEPISDILRGVLDGHIVLDREISERGRYPAINLLKSISRSLPEAANDQENNLITLARQNVSLYEQNEMMVRSGLYSSGADSDLDLAIKLWPELDSFLGKCGDQSPEQCFDSLRLIMRRAGVL